LVYGRALDPKLTPALQLVWCSRPGAPNSVGSTLVRCGDEIERAIVAEHEANGGVIVTVSPLSTVNGRIIALAARYKVSAVYPLQISIRLSKHYGNGPRQNYSGLRPANLTTLAHFSVSSMANLPKSPGEPG
jgi:hypothetical protein